MLKKSNQHLETKLVVDELYGLIGFEKVAFEEGANLLDVFWQFLGYLGCYLRFTAADLNRLWHLTSLLLFHHFPLWFILNFKLFLVRFNILLLTGAGFTTCVIGFSFLWRNLEYVDCWFQCKRLSFGKIQSIEILFRTNKNFPVKFLLGCTKDFFKEVKNISLGKGLLLLINHLISIFILQSLVVLTNQCNKTRT